MDPKYQAHLIRLQWNPDRQQWHATVQDIHAGQTHYFFNDQAFLHHLKKCLAPPHTDITPIQSTEDQTADHSDSPAA
ncbi:MAG: hypothetical protein AAF633_15160 [Chloroflexota bacterium]